MVASSRQQGRFLHNFAQIKLYYMSVLELKNNLLRMVVETDDPLLLKQLIALFSTLREEKDWWDLISETEKQKIELGMRQATEGKTVSHEIVRSEVQKILGIA